MSFLSPLALLVFSLALPLILLYVLKTRREESGALQGNSRLDLKNERG